MDLMEYKIRSTTEKIKAMEKKPSSNPSVIVVNLKTKVTELEKSIQDRNRHLDGIDDTVLYFICRKKYFYEKSYSSISISSISSISVK